MTTPPAPPPGSDPADRPQDTPPGGWPTPGQPGAFPPPGQYGQPGAYPPPPGQYADPGAYPPPGQYGGDYPGATYPSTSPFPAGQHGYPGYGEVPGGYPQPAYAGVPGGYADPNAPFGYDPMGRPYSDKQKLIAGLLQILVGGFGVGRFYTGHTGIAVAQLVVTLVTCGIGALWGLIDGIMILVNGGTDAQGRPLREN